MPFKVIRDDHFRYQLKAATSYASIIITYILSCTISKIWQIIDQIFTVERGCFSLMHSCRVNP